MSNKLYSPLIQDPVTKQFYKHELNTHTGIVLKTQQKFINNLIKERDQYKAERDTLIEENRKLKEENSKLKELTLRFDESHRINIREIDRLKEYISKLEDE